MFNLASGYSPVPVTGGASSFKVVSTSSGLGTGGVLPPFYRCEDALREEIGLGPWLTIHNISI